MKKIIRRLGFWRDRIRTAYWSRMMFAFGEHSRVLGRIKVYSPNNITIGEHTVLNEGCILNGRDVITIGSHVNCSHNTIINTSGLEYRKEGSKRIHIHSPVVIENGVWLGSGVIVNPGVTVGENSVVGAGAVVTKNIPKNTVAVGVPAKVVKHIEYGE